jgi:hypothetical protein
LREGEGRRKEEGGRKKEGRRRKEGGGKRDERGLDLRSFESTNKNREVISPRHVKGLERREENKERSVWVTFPSRTRSLVQGAKR